MNTDQTKPDSVPPDDRYQGFSLRSVTWGYRDIFAKAIEELFREGCLGPEREEATSTFFDMLKRSDQSCFDDVLRQFLGALNPRNRWIMDLPGIFTDITDLGWTLARSKLYYGSRFFRTLAEGGMGTTPAQVRECLNRMRRLREIDDELAMAFLAGYAHLAERLRPAEMDRYLDAALQMHRVNRNHACDFLRGELSTSETYILAITQECRLCDVNESLRALLKALTGDDCEVDDLGKLDSDDLIDRGTSTLTVNGHVYLPARCRRFDTTRANRNWYRLCGIASAAMLLDDSFPRIHGHPDYRTCVDLTGDEPGRVNLFQVMEFVRVLRRARRRWPGARRLIAWGLRAEMANPSGGDAERLLADAMDDSLDAPALRAFRAATDDAANCFDSVERLDEPWALEVRAAYPGIASHRMEPIAFLSDFLFSVSFSVPSSDQLVADLKQAARRRGKGEDDEFRDESGTGRVDGAAPGKGDSEEAGTAAAYVYDEWDFQQNEYHAAWCRVYEKSVEPATITRLHEDWLDESRKIRSVFERLKPDLARREKRLAQGDDINIDLLTSHLVDRLLEPSPAVRFYEKPIINHRDLTVLILLDVSGSTAEQLGDQARVLDVEKQASIILGQGLAALGDRFAVCGFSSNGREHCEYLVFKNFDEAWSAEAIGRVMAAWPRSSTRIGPALRHSGYLLSEQSARQRLILLVTDGKPMDQGYEPNTRYAQHDVRMACEENARQDIHTFAISTEENSQADMEIMFPRRRFVILPNLKLLPRALPTMYLRLTL